MTELPDGSKTSFNVPAAIDAADLLRYYSFDLGGYPVEQLLGHWLTQYSADWIRLAVIEALYQGRYKAVSVEQILVLWQRRQQAFCHFNREFERLVCNKIPQQLNLTARSPVSSHPQASESTLPSYLSHRKVVLHLPNTQQVLSLLQTPAKIPPLRITPATHGSSASRLLNLVSPTPAASQPLPPFPVDHIDQPVGELDRTPCPPIAELRTVVAQPALELPRLTPEQPQAQPKPEVNRASIATESAAVAPTSVQSPSSPSTKPSLPKSSQPQEPRVTPAAKPPGPVPKLGATKTPTVQQTSKRSPQISKPELHVTQIPNPSEPAPQPGLPDVPQTVERAADSIESTPELAPLESPPVALQPAPPAEVKPKRVVELPIWQRIQSDPLLTSQLTHEAPTAQAESEPAYVTPAVSGATAHCQDLDSHSPATICNGKEQFLEQIRQGIRFSLDLGLTNRAMQPKLRLLLSQMYQLDQTIFNFNQPIHHFVPASDSPDFHGKLRAVAQSTDRKPHNGDREETPSASPIEQNS
ncbi:hypothetical protein [Pantanalinema sp. GBBB05]|uniref:hypothetical protein n=1 Tax=Pantanalinema sp. GBBB05 TaxID=2604139 RepID=UPI001E1707ED|nr:hypothetical protein [Pantanalinema sp. GBBB05]